MVYLILTLRVQIQNKINERQVQFLAVFLAKNSLVIRRIAKTNDN